MRRTLLPILTSLVLSTSYAQNNPLKEALEMKQKFEMSLQEYSHHPLAQDSLKSKASIIPTQFSLVGLLQQHANKVFWNQEGIFVDGEEVYEFHDAFLEKSVLSYVPAPTKYDELNGSLLWAANNSSAKYMGVLGGMIPQGMQENVLVLDLETKRNDSYKTRYVFSHNDNLQLTSAQVEISYLPKTDWPLLSGVVDTDADGMDDRLEKLFWDSLDQEGDGDYDGDGKSNKYELQHQSNPVQNPRFALRNEKLSYILYDDGSFAVSGSSIINKTKFAKSMDQLYENAVRYYLRYKEEIATEKKRQANPYRTY